MSPRMQDSTGCWKTRYTVALLSLMGLAISFMTRVNISVAIVDMVNETALEERALRSSDAFHFGAAVSSRDDPDVCPGKLVLKNQAGGRNGEFAWDKQKQGEILAAFYYGYAAGHIPGGLLADRFGGRIVFGIGIFLSSLLTVLTPISAWTDAYLLFANRVGQGFTQGGIIPAIQTLTSRWAPDHERSKFSVIFLGMYIGIIASMALTGAMCEMAGGWPLAFYSFGAVGLLWCIPWFLLVADSPAKHPSIDPAERCYIEAYILPINKKRLPVPWRSVLTTPALWALVAIMVTFDWTFYLYISSLPLYLASVLHFDMQSNGFLSAAPHVISAGGSLFFGWLTDFVFRKGYISKLHGFRIINGMGTLVPTATLIVVSQVGCNAPVIVAVLAINGFLMSANCSGPYMNMHVIAPNYSGTVVGIVNTFANLSGIVVPYIVGAFTNANQTRAGWNNVFYVTVALSVVAYLVYAIFTSAEAQPWNDPPTEKTAEVKGHDGIDNITFNSEDVRHGGLRSFDT
ncbi:sialin-like [Schistocerca cancellata]|uniref:sialin-like n=1 Tax=Schistocerca cancellata TaxID=274614 RepID=UPI0021182521|nr:sialin-like [Schistocerca cancellata]